MFLEEVIQHHPQFTGREGGTRERFPWALRGSQEQDQELSYTWPRRADAPLHGLALLLLPSPHRSPPQAPWSLCTNRHALWLHTCCRATAGTFWCPVHRVGHAKICPHCEVDSYFHLCVVYREYTV